MSSKLLEHLKITPDTPQRFFCTRCDHNIVDSTKPETGVFMSVGGHVMENDGRWAVVLFACCTECLK